MTRLIWGSSGERFFETGADRGVLYLPGQAGVPWNGLKTVSEAPDGGDPQPYYIDGFKYINLAAAEEFKAKITAFSAPKEFRVCDGTVGIHNGLFVTQQPRKPFSFSYRTLVGNDIQGVDHGYKIHLVYYALASPTSRENASLNNTPTPIDLSWDITTTPPQITGFKPTSHFVIDSRYTPKLLMSAIEDILYGSTNSDARLPTVSELMDLFNSQGPIRGRNLINTPSFELSGAAVVVETNVNTNPKMYPTSAGWVTTPANATLTATANGIQIDLTANPPGGALLYSSAPFAAANGDRWCGSMEVTVPAGYPAATLVLRVYSYGQEAIIADSGNVVVQPGQTVTIAAPSTLAVTAATTGIRQILYGVSPTAVGTRFVARNALLAKGLVPRPYYDGGTQPILRTNLANPTQQTALVSTITPGISYLGSTWSRAKPNDTAARRGVRYSVPTSISLIDGATYRWAIEVANDELNPVTVEMDWCDVAPATSFTIQPGERRFIGINAFRATYDNTYRFGDLAIVSTTQQSILFRLALIEQTTLARDPFDGNSVLPGFIFGFVGAANASPSIMWDADFSVRWTGTAGASSSELTGLSLTGVTASNGVVIRSTRWSKQGLYSARAIPNHPTNRSYFEFTGTPAPIGIDTGIVWLHFEAPYTGATRPRTIGLGYNPGNPSASSAQAPNVPGDYEIRQTATMTAPGRFIVFSDTAFGDPDTWWDLAMLAQGSYDGPAITGDLTSDEMNFYAWEGTPNNSPSTWKSWY